MLVLDRELGEDADLHHAGAKRARRGAVNPAVEEALDPAGAAQIEILAQHLLEERPSLT